jgi:hypothetical protein
MKGVKRFGVKGTVAYKLELPPSLVGVHDIFQCITAEEVLEGTRVCCITESGTV